MNAGVHVIEKPSYCFPLEIHLYFWSLFRQPVVIILLSLSM